MKKNKIVINTLRWMNLKNMPRESNQETLFDSMLYEIPRQGKSIETERRSAVAYG